MPKDVQVPTVKGMGNAFKDFGFGCIGGLAFALAYSIFGAWGLLAAPILAGSMLKGSDRGTVIATMAGFLLFAGLGAWGGGGGGGGNQETI